MEKIEKLLKVTLSTDQKAHIKPIYESTLIRPSFINKHFLKVTSMIIGGLLLIGWNPAIALYVASFYMTLIVAMNIFATKYVSPERYGKIKDEADKLKILDFALFNTNSIGLERIFDLEMFVSIVLGIIAYTHGYYFYMIMLTAFILSYVVFKLTLRDGMKHRLDILSKPIEKAPTAE